MNLTPALQPAVAESISSAILPSETELHRATSGVEARPAAAPPARKRSGYGLPCLKCKTYYAADLSACPVCKTEERVAPMPVVTAKSNSVLPESLATAPDDTALEEERERFLREFKARVYASDGQIDGEIDAPGSLGCSQEANHQGSSATATVCQSCYALLQQRVDQLEAALHTDLKEATQVIYDAVWSDPSDPSKTYHNAARAVMGELRKRAGIAAVLGPLQPLAH